MIIGDIKKTYMKAPINRWTFSVKPIREWVESRSERYTLNLFAGTTKLNINEVRNDLDNNMPANFHYDALDFIKFWLSNTTEKFDTIILDPPFRYRKSMELYNGNMNSRFKLVKDNLYSILKSNGCIITFGYHSVSLGVNREFKQEEILLISHGGAIHDTIAVKERYFGK